MTNNNVKPSNPMKVITGPETRWSYANVWEPKSINGGTPHAQVQRQPDHPEERHQDPEKDSDRHRGSLQGGRGQAEGQRQDRPAALGHQEPAA